MKMKKSVLFAILLPLSIVTLSGCVKYNGRNKDGSPKNPTSTSTPTTTEPAPTSTDTSSTEPIPPAPTGQINVYFVLGPNGSYTGVDPNPTAAAAKFLAANTVVQTIDRGATLPGKDVIKSSVSGSTFLHWVDRATTDVVTTAPDAAEAVLVAVFEGGDGGNTPTPSSGLPTSGYGFLFDTAAGADPYYKVAQSVGKWTDGDGNEYDQYKIDNFQLVKDQVFSLYDFGSQARWVIDLDGWSCGGTSATDTKWQEYLSKSSSTYTVLKTFNAKDIYIKLRYEHDILYMGVE